MPADDALMQALNFTAEDLRYNQRDELSPRQLEEIQTTKSGYRAITGLVALVCLGISAYALLTPVGGGERFALCINTGIWGGVAIVFLSISFGKESTVTTVQRVQGSAKLQIDYNRSHKYYLLIINKTDFKVSEDVYKLVQEDDDYIIYYLNIPVGRQILSMEWAT